MAGPANALQVFASVWIPRPQFSDKPCWHDVIYMTPHANQFEVHSAGLHFTISTKSRRPITAPASSVRGRTGPSTVHTFPTDRLFLRPKFCLTELAPTVTIGLAAKTPNSEDFCLAIFAVGTAHGHTPPSSLNDCRGGRQLIE